MEALIERAQELRDELDTLDELDELTDEQSVRVDEIVSEVGELDERIAKFQARAEARAKVAELAKTVTPTPTFEAPNVNRDLGSPYEVPEIGTSPAEFRGRALKAVEAESNYDLTDSQKEHVSRLLEANPGRVAIAKHVLATGSDDYKNGWTKAVTGRGMLMSDGERNALARAMSLTDGEGGFAVPFPIDPTLILLGDGSSNPFRQISRVETGVTDSWQGLASTAMTASWDNQVTEVSDDATTFTQPIIPAEFAQAFVPASIEIAGDYPGLVNDLQLLFANAKDDLEATAFATGSGTNQPTGIVTEIDGTGNDISSATTDVFAVADVYSTFETLGPRYRSKASWVANVAIINDIRAFGTANSHAFSAHLTDPAPLNILGRPIYESSAMDGVVNAAAENNVLVFGDFSNYLIYDRVGFSLEYIPHLFNTANNLPDGRRGWYAYWRVGAESINDDAFVLLNVT